MKDAGALTIGLDLGTSSAKGCVLSQDGRVVASLSRALQTKTVGEGRLEFDALEYRNTVFGLVTDLAREVPGHVGALAIAAASGNTVLLDGDNRPLGNFVSWMDKRARRDPSLTSIQGHSSEAVYSTVGWPYSGLMTLAHLLWMRRHQPSVLDRASRVAMNNDFIGWHLCGHWCLDRSTATTSYLQDQVQGTWHRPFLDLLGIDESMLSELGETGAPMGSVLPEISESCGLASDSVLVRGCFDHPSAARACGIGPDDILLSLGTSWVALAQVADRDRAIANGFLLDPAGSKSWYAMSSIPEAGRMIDALIERLYPGSTASAIEQLTRDVMETPIGRPGDLPQLSAPWNDISPLPAQTAARRLVEVFALETRMRIEALKPEPRRVVAVGGPSANLAILQVLADVLGRPVLFGPAGFAGAIGAATIAMGQRYGAGSSTSPPIAARLRAIDPDRVMSDRYDELYREYVSDHA